MGYSCPVCGDPQADGIHLANHLAFTAIARGGEHETWLEEHVSGWEGMDDEELASEVHPLADETEYPHVFEDTTDQYEAKDGTGPDHTYDTGHDHTHSTGHDRDTLDSSAGHHGESPTPAEDLPDNVAVPADEIDEKVEDVLERARELTRQRRSGDDE